MTKVSVAVILSLYFAHLGILTPAFAQPGVEFCDVLAMKTGLVQGSGNEIGTKFEDLGLKTKPVAKGIDRQIDGLRVNVYKVDDPLVIGLIKDEIETYACQGATEIIVGIRIGNYSSLKPVSTEVWLKGERNRLKKSGAHGVKDVESSELIDVWGTKTELRVEKNIADLTILGGICRRVDSSNGPMCGMARWVVYHVRMRNIPHSSGINN